MLNNQYKSELITTRTRRANCHLEWRKLL